LACTIIQIQPEPLLKALHGIMGPTTEAIQILVAFYQHLNKQCNLKAILAKFDECFVAELAEFIECM
jgi:hypothetical protein